MEASTILLNREVPKVAEGKTGFGFFCIPEGYIPSIARIPDADLIKEFDEDTREKYKDDIRKFPGDFAERKAYEVLRKHYTKRADVS